MTLADEVVARVPDGTDTGNDVADFAYATATPGTPNHRLSEGLCARSSP